jgi:hypothetical protein
MKTISQNCAGLFVITCLVFFWSTDNIYAQKDKKDKKEEKKEEKFEKTGTSADAFLESAFNLGQDMKKFNGSYADIKVFAYMLLTQPGSVAGKDLLSVVNAARGVAGIPAQLDVSMVQEKASALKEIKDAVVKNNITEFIKNLNAANAALGKMPEQSAKLASEGAALPDKLQAEMTGLKKAKLPKVLSRVKDANKDLDDIKTQAPALVANITGILSVLAAIAASLGT